MAEDIAKRWNPVWLFIASQESFYFDSCHEVIVKEGDTKRLDWIDLSIQEKYLALLKEFEH